MANYIYQKYNSVASTNGYTYLTSTSSDTSTNYAVGYYNATWGFNSSTGIFTINSGTYATTITSSGAVYSGSGAQKLTIYSGSSYNWTVKTYTATTLTTHTKGTTSYGNIIALDGTYPDNGYNSSDGYWYVKVGPATYTMLEDENHKCYSMQ